MNKWLVVALAAVGFCCAQAARAQGTLCEPELVVTVNGKKMCRQPEPAPRRDVQRSEEDISAVMDAWDADTWRSVTALCNSGNTRAALCPRILETVSLCEQTGLPESNRTWCASKGLQGLRAFLEANGENLQACFAVFKGVRTDAKVLQYTADRAKSLERVQQAVIGDVKKALEITRKYAQEEPLYQDLERRNEGVVEEYRRRGEALARRLANIGGAGQAALLRCVQEERTNCDRLNNIDEISHDANIAIAIAKSLPEMKCHRFIGAVRQRYGW